MPRRLISSGPDGKHDGTAAHRALPSGFSSLFGFLLRDARRRIWKQEKQDIETNERLNVTVKMLSRRGYQD